MDLHMIMPVSLVLLCCLFCPLIAFTYIISYYIIKLITPHYNLDHEPTYDNAEAPVSDDLKHVTELWFDPLTNLRVESPPDDDDDDGSGSGSGKNKDSSTIDEEIAEQESRKVAAQRLLDSLQPSRDLERAQQESLDEALNEVISIGGSGRSGGSGSGSVSGLLDGDGISISDSSVSSDGSVSSGIGVGGSGSVLDPWNEEDEVDGNELLIRPNLSKRPIRRTFDTRTVKGRARSQHALIRYTINQIRDMQAEIIMAEQDLATRKKSGRRKQRKTKSKE